MPNHWDGKSGQTPDPKASRNGQKLDLRARRREQKPDPWAGKREKYSTSAPPLLTPSHVGLVL